MLAMLASLLWLLPTSFAQTTYDIDSVSHAVVQVRVADGTGSGTLFIRDNRVLVLTNKHVVRGFNSAQIAVLKDVNEPAEVAFAAELIGFVDEYDIALLAVLDSDSKEAISPQALLAGEYGFPFQPIPVASSANEETAVRRGEHVGIFGYPGVLDNELVYTTGIVSAVQYTDLAGKRVPLWYRTNAEMSPGNSGGTALNSRGEFIGIPTFITNEEVTGSRLGSLLGAEFALAITANEASLLTSWADETRTDDNRLDYRLEPYFGTTRIGGAELAGGHNIEVTAGGSVNSRYIGNGCLGYASSRPDVRLQLTESQANLFINFLADTSGDDTALLVNNPAGEWLCNDDEDGLNPGIAITEATAGQYDIWVASYSEGEFISGDLRLSNQAFNFSSAVTQQRNTSNAPSTPNRSAVGNTINLAVNGEPHYETVQLSAGFWPDPYTVDVNAGGSVNVTDWVDGCLGFVASRPDVRLQWQGGRSALQVYFTADEVGDDTVLVVHGPDGQWYCNDDAHSTTLNPSLRFESAASGAYTIWVGSYGQGNWVQGKLYITEMNTTVP